MVSSVRHRPTPDLHERQLSGIRVEIGPPTFDRMTPLFGEVLMARLNGKITLISGAARGIGEAIARSFVLEGALAYLTDIETDSGEALERELGTRAIFKRLDVRDEQDWARVTAEVISSHGRLDVVVNNAGITGFEGGVVAHDPENTSLEDWRAVHRTNLDGVFLGCKYAIRAMRRTKTGSIINISSRSGLVGIPGAQLTHRPRRPFATTPRPLPSGAHSKGLRFAATRSIRPLS